MDLANPVRSGRGRPGRIDILIVEDDEDLATLIAFHLDGAGYKPGWTGRVAEALNALTRQGPRLIFLDLNLLDGTGEELISRAREAGLRIPPVVVVTGYRVPSRVQACGAVTAIYKPNVQMSMLVSLADTHVGDARISELRRTPPVSTPLPAR